ncbi:MAG: lipoyl domain-containing protein [Pirellulales bacterium]|nr:lipoyl domain-containing protein [Pirellulales bacterium]
MDAPPRHPLRVPELGLDQTPARLSLWLVKPGCRIDRGQPVAEVTAGPLVVDLPSPVDGALVEKLVETDQPVSVGQTLGWIEERW